MPRVCRNLVCACLLDLKPMMAVILIDSLISLQTLANIIWNYSSALVYEILYICTTLGHNGVSVVLERVPDHIRFDGNELANKMA